MHFGNAVLTCNFKMQFENAVECSFHHGSRPGRQCAIPGGLHKPAPLQQNKLLEKLIILRRRLRVLLGLGRWVFFHRVSQKQCVSEFYESGGEIPRSQNTHCFLSLQSYIYIIYKFLEKQIDFFFRKKPPVLKRAIDCLISF